MKKVLIVSYYFPPQNMLASKRYGIMCKYMNSCGWEPYIITLNSHGDLLCPIKEDHIIRISSESKVINGELSIKQSFFLWVCESFKLVMRSMEKTDYLWLNEVKKELIKIKRVCPKPDIIIGTFPPIGNILIARYLAKQYRVPWIAEVRDLISQYNDDIPKGWKKSKVLDACVERYLLSSAAGIVTVTEGFKVQLKKYYHKKFSVIYNGWDIREVKTDSMMDRPYPYIYYAGSLYEHRMEGVYLLLNTLKELPENSKIKFILRLVGTRNLMAEVNKYIKKNNLTERVSIEKACNDDIVRSESYHAMINIVFSDFDSKKHYLLSTIPGKVMELIGERPPILAIANPKVEFSKILTATQKGIVTFDKEEILQFLLKNYSNYNGNEKVIKKYSRRNQTIKLCKFLDGFMR